MTATELSIEGAKESRSTIKQFHARLNSSDLIPEQALRRNSRDYPLVCYVNNIMGLFLSKNYEPIPVLIARAAEYMATVPPASTSSAYYIVVTQYLSQVTYHLRNFVEGVEFYDNRIPISFLEAGPQKAP